MLLRDSLQATLGDSYTVEREITGGGMSHVFTAIDRDLGRRVVVKVLPPDLREAVSADRFRREIAVAATLQHPHIVPLLSTGDDGGLLYFTMPFIEGDSLRERLVREGELSVPDTLRSLREIASALAYAHRRGIVHRDIKPENILFSDGAAVVTDFGIAKALVVSRTGGETKRSTITAFGVAVGTPTYMAPEQAAGDPSVDHRADIYALGCVAYEMLAGRAPFDERTPQQMMAAHASATPVSLVERRPNAPPALVAVVMQCLEKRPSDRPQSADEIVRALGGIAATPAGTATLIGSAVGRTPRWRVAVPWVIAAAGVATATATVVGRRSPEPVAARPLHFVVRLPAGTRIDPSNNFAHVALAPDGSALAYSAGNSSTPTVTPDPDSGFSVHLQRFDVADPVRLKGTTGAGRLVFSTDGKWIAFNAEGRGFRKVSLESGAVVSLLDVQNLGGAWLPDGRFIFGGGGYGGRLMVWNPADTAAPVPLLVPSQRRRESSFRHPQLLPDGRILFSIDRSGLRHSVGTMRVGDTTPTILIENALHARYLPPGFIVFARDSTLFAIRFDEKNVRVTEPAVPVLDGVAGANGNAMSDFAISANGTIAYIAGPFSGGGDDKALLWGDREGKVVELSLPRRAYRDGRVSPDQRMLALATVNDNGERVLWIAHIERPSFLPASTEPVGEFAWSPDGQSVIYRKADRSLWSVPANLSAGEQRLLNGAIPPGTAPGLQTKDGKLMVFGGVATGSRLGRDIWVVDVPAAGDTAPPSPRPWLQTTANESPGALSPDGKWLAYLSDASGRDELYLQPFPGRGPVTPVSSGGAAGLVTWIGNEIIYQRSGAAVGPILSVSVDLGAGPRVSEPRVFHQRAGGSMYHGVGDDGRRVLLSRYVNDSVGVRTANEIRVIVNWIEIVKAKLAGGFER